MNCDFAFGCALPIITRKYCYQPELILMKKRIGVKNGLGVEKGWISGVAGAAIGRLDRGWNWHLATSARLAQ